MKSLKAKEAIEYAHRWSKLKRKLADLNDEVEFIKDYFKSQINEGEAVLCGDFVIGSTKCSRSGLDRDALVEEIGPEIVEKFTKVTEFVKLDIKVAS